MRTIIPTILAAAFFLLAPVQKQAFGLTQDEALQIVFTEIEKRIVREYFDEHLGPTHTNGGSGKKDKKNKNAKAGGKGLPPGLAKRETLPPGLAKQLQRKGTLPPGLTKHGLPDDLHHRLPAVRPGTERIIVGNDVLLLQAGTNFIIDVIRDALLRN